MKKLILTYSQLNEELTSLPNNIRIGGSLDMQNITYDPDTPLNIINYSNLTIAEFIELVHQQIIKIYKTQGYRNPICKVLPNEDGVIYGRVIYDRYSYNYSIYFINDTDFSGDDILRLSELGLFSDTVILCKDYVCSKIMVKSSYNMDYIYLSDLHHESTRLNIYQIAKKLINTI